jgi:hypothetical protein
MTEFFNTSPFERSHGRSPRGRGSWAFCSNWVLNREDYLDHTVFSPSMTYGEAKKWAKAQPELANVDVIAVLP